MEHHHENPQVWAKKLMSMNRGLQKLRKNLSSESALKAKQYKLEAKALERADVCSFLLEHFDQELSALQEGKLGFL